MLFWVAKLKVNFVTESIQKMTTLEHVASDLYVMIIYYNQQKKTKQNKQKIVPWTTAQDKPVQPTYFVIATLQRSGKTCWVQQEYRGFSKNL